MPADRYLVRFAEDEEGRHVHHQTIIETASAPWPPHRWAAMAVASYAEAPPEEANHTVAVVLAPDASIDHEAYQQLLAEFRPHIDFVAEAAFPGHASLQCVWFVQSAVSKWDEDTVASPHLMRGVLYRPATYEEIVQWAGPEVAARGTEGVINP